MYDFHLHSNVSFDSTELPEEILRAAEQNRLKEICFTDHYDYNSEREGKHYLFNKEDYMLAYKPLKSQKVKIRMGVEFGLTTWNQNELNNFVHDANLDFVIGSIHFVDGYDPYYKEFWEGIDFKTAIDKYMLQTLECVKKHDNYDVLGHLTYVCKSSYNPTATNISYSEITDITDEILKIIIKKGKGIEVNTSGVDRVGDFLPSLEYVRRFRELGGEIITVGSDAHDRTRVGQYINEALDMIKEIFPYVCTFEERKPIFHNIK